MAAGQFPSMHPASWWASQRPSLNREVLALVLLPNFVDASEAAALQFDA